MTKIPLRLILIFLKIVMLFIPRKKYEQKMYAIRSMEEKKRESDLSGWEYRKISSTDKTYNHRFYWYPGAVADAPVVLMLHGINFDGRTFLNMKSLATYYNIIAYDFPEESGLYTGKLDNFIELVDDFLKSMAIDTCFLVGVSFGGVVALRFTALQGRDRVKKLVCISTPLAGFNSWEINNSIRLDTWLHSRADYQVYWLMEKMIARFERKFSKKQQVLLDNMLRIKKLAFYRQVFSALRGYSGVHDVKQIRQGVLIMHGSKDSLFQPKKEMKKFQAVLPQIDYHLIKYGTHAMAYLQGEMIAMRIKQFFMNA